MHHFTKTGSTIIGKTQKKCRFPSDGGCSSTFSDGEGPGGSLTLSLDVPLNENYNPDLHSRTGPGVSENTVNDW
jgi:hypothetical protein